MGVHRNENLIFSIFVEVSVPCLLTSYFVFGTLLSREIIRLC